MRFLFQRGFILIKLIIVLVIIAGGIGLYFAIWGGDNEVKKKVSVQPPQPQVASNIPQSQVVKPTQMANNTLPPQVVKPKPQTESSVVSEGWKMKNARHIAVNDRRWSAPFLYEISHKIFVKNGVLNYHRLMVIIQEYNNNCDRYCDEFHCDFFLTSFKDDINIGDIEKRVRKMNIRYDHHDYRFENLCEDSKRKVGWEHIIKAKKPLTHLFDTSIFNTIIADADMTHSEFGLWLYNVGQHAPLFKAVKLLLEQYHDLAERLTLLHEGRAKIVREYGEASNVKPLDSDIKKLSALGWELIQVTKRFFVTIKPRMVKLDVAATRQQALAGLKTFENEIDSAQTTSSQSLDDVIANIDQAVRKLEEAINQ